MSDSSIEEQPQTGPSILTRKVGNGASQGAGEGLDRRVEKRTWTPRRLALAGGVLALVLLIGWAIASSFGGRRLNVERDRLTVEAVTVGPFQENIAATGNVLPRTTVFLDAVEGGRVEETFVLEGTRVEAGEPLLRLSNNDLQLRLLSTDAQRIEQINRLQDIRFRMEQNTLSLRQQLAQMNYNIQRLARQHARNEDLLEKDAISQQDFDEVFDELEYWRRTKNLTLEGYRQDSLRMTNQLRQMEGSVGRMEANYAVLQRILDNLTVRAPVSGHLTALDAEIGQLKRSGDRFGQIDVLDGYKVRAGIDEFYIARVQRGQPATATVAGQEYQLTVTRVYPEVRDGRFEVDLEFAGEEPEGIRRGQTIRFLLQLSEPAEAVLLPRGGFFQSTGGNWAYVLDGDEAVRRDIRLGRQNNQHYEVLAGLDPGDRVITSSYDTFGDADRLVLK
ncbi:MAG: HlyD family efflux transporter periplasmic adaptor subunit [Rhodothermales bacterium]|nr:HlyD family efflux transporter periplasmic adaptor subunit [Rhodothermales bacterium]